MMTDPAVHRRILEETAALLAAPPRRRRPQPAHPVVEVDPTEQVMLYRAEAIFNASPGLQLTFGTAEAFGRKCLATARREVA